MLNRKIRNLIVAKASDAYPDGLIADCWDRTTGATVPSPDVGDGLAVFVARELGEVTRGANTVAEARREAVRALERADQELRSVIAALAEIPDDASV